MQRLTRRYGINDKVNKLILIKKRRSPFSKDIPNLNLSNKIKQDLNSQSYITGIKY